MDDDDDTTASPVRIVGSNVDDLATDRRLSIGDRAHTITCKDHQMTDQKSLPLEVMAMIAECLGSPCDAHSLSLVSKDWNTAFKIAFPSSTSPRFVLNAIYGGDGGGDNARLSEVDRIDDEGAMAALCTVVKDPIHLARLARPQTQELYSLCFKRATHALNKEALAALIIYGNTQSDWVFLACIHTINAFFSSPVYNQSAPGMFYQMVALHAGGETLSEVVRATIFRRFTAGIDCLLDMELAWADDQVRLLLQTTATMSEDLLLRVLDVFPRQTGAILSAEEGHANLVSLVVRSGWMEATEKMLSLVADTAQNSVLLLRYAVLANKGDLVDQILFPRRRSSRKRLRASSSSIAGNERPVMLTAEEEGILRDAITLGHEEIAMLLCRAAPWLVSVVVVASAIRSGHRADFVQHLMEHLDAPQLATGAESFAKAAVSFKNYEVVALLVSDTFKQLKYSRETLLSFLNLLGPFKGLLFNVCMVARALF